MEMSFNPKTPTVRHICYHCALISSLYDHLYYIYACSVPCRSSNAVNLPDPEAVTLSEFNRAAKTNFLFIRESC